MTPIPLFIVEEHHEAFFIWNYAVTQGVIPAGGNTLLHVDEHADMEVPKLHTSLESLPADDLQAVHDFTYDELRIYDFLVAAIYQGRFKDLHWLSHKKHESTQPIRHIYSRNGDGKNIQMTGNLYQAGFFSSDRHTVITKMIAMTKPFPASESLILDIDIDYFSCMRSPWTTLADSTVEITPAAYDRLRADKYHALRLNAMTNVGDLKLYHEGGKYYLRVDKQYYPSPLKVSETKILERIEQFGTYLQNNDIQPRMIDLCRSRFSGYTPEDQWEFIETHLLKKLATIYDLDVIHLEEIRRAL